MRAKLDDENEEGQRGGGEISLPSSKSPHSPSTDEVNGGSQARCRRVDCGGQVQ